MAGHIKALISIKGTYSYWTEMKFPIHSDESPRKKCIYLESNTSTTTLRYSIYHSKLPSLTCYFESTQRVKKVLATKPSERLLMLNIAWHKPQETTSLKPLKHWHCEQKIDTYRRDTCFISFIFVLFVRHCKRLHKQSTSLQKRFNSGT